MNTSYQAVRPSVIVRSGSCGFFKGEGQGLNSFGDRCLPVDRFTIEMRPRLATRGPSWSILQLLWIAWQ